MSKIKLSDYIAKRLKEHGVEHFFMVSGGGAMHLNDSLGRAIPYTANHHEQACAIAAEGYARINQELAVVNVTTGPGGLNCLNGVFGQWTDSVPVLYISGQVKYSTTMASCHDIPLRQLGDQEVDIISVVKPLTKYAKMVTEPNEIKYHLDKAIYEATTGRFGPVWLDIPINIQAAMIEEDELAEFIPPEKEEYKFDIDVVINKLKTAQRPLIVVGNGIHCSKQENTFYDFIKGLNIPVVTTFNGVDLMPTDHKNFCGRIGTVGQRAGNFNLQNADVILFLGTRNNIRQVSYNWENFAKNAFKMVVDIDKSELEKPLVKPDLAIHCDLTEFLSALSEHKSEFLTNKNTEWLDFCKNLVNKYSFENTKEYQSKENIINVYDFVHKLSKDMQEGDILITANGSACVCAHQVFEIKNGQRVFWNSGDASMGYGLPAAIGACCYNQIAEFVPSPLAGEGAQGADEGYSKTNYAIPSPLAGEGARRADEGYYNNTHHRIYADYIKEFARSLRKNQTKQEQKLWELLKNSKTGYKFRRQHQIDNKYVADFVCLEKRLIIELDGGHHCNSDYDEQRAFYLRSKDFRILRFWNNEIDKNLEGCYELIVEELSTPHPNPLPQGAREEQGRVVCLEGDGSIMMNIQELQTIVHNNLPIKIFVINNQGYSSIRQTQRNFFNGRMTGSGDDSGVSVPDFVEVGKAFGLNAKRIENPNTMEKDIAEVLSSNVPILCEVITEKEYAFLPKLSAKKLPDGTMISPSLEDMFPFLGREEFEECKIEE